MYFLKLFIFLLFVSNITAPFTSLVWSSCSTAAQVPKMKIERLSMLPMVSFKIYLVWQKSNKYCNLLDAEREYVKLQFNYMNDTYNTESDDITVVVKHIILKMIHVSCYIMVLTLANFQVYWKKTKIVG